QLWNISDDEVYDSLVIENRLIIADTALQPLLDRYSTSFGGSNINMIKRRVTVYTIDTGKIDIIKSRMGRHRELLSFEQARQNRSLHELRNQFNQIVNLAIEYRRNKYNKLNVLIHTDIMANNNIVTLTSNENTSTLEDSIKRYNPILITVNSSSHSDISKRQNKASIRDISNMVLSGDGLCDNICDFTCSIGLWVKNRQNIDYLVTAGHCIIDSDSGSISTDFYHIPWSTTQNTTQNTNFKFLGKSVFASIEPYDFGLIQVMGTDFKLAANIIKNIGYSQYPELFINRNLKVYNHGIHICKVGFASHLSCGFIKGLNGIFITKDGITSDMFITTLYSIGGDSGGPSFVFSAFSQDLRSVDLVGIHIGSNGINEAFALPIDSILRSFDIHVVPVN
ncbi:15400_t:CDS:1, partial [Cetraspora pellucida]